MQHLRGEAQPIFGTTRNLKTHGTIVMVLLALVLLILLISYACGGPKGKQAHVQIDARTLSAKAWALERYTQAAQAVNKEPAWPRGNDGQPPTITFQTDRFNIWQGRVDGTNEAPDEPERRFYFHNTGLQRLLQPSESLTVEAIAQNPDFRIDYAAWGDKTATPIWGECRDLPLLEGEEMAFFSPQGPGCQFAALFLILVDQNGRLLPGSKGQSWNFFKPGHSSTMVTYRNTTEQPLLVRVGLHRNLYFQGRDAIMTNTNRPQYKGSSWRGGQYWDVRVNIFPVLAASLAQSKSSDTT